MTMAMRALLERKGFDVWTVAPDDTVLHAITLMADKGVGAVLVLEDERLVGIMSERDYTREVILVGRSSADTAVRAIMSSPVVTAGTEATLEDCLQLMTTHGIRHLPLVDTKGGVFGVVSCRDVLGAMVRARGRTIFQLERYIMGV